MTMSCPEMRVGSLPAEAARLWGEREALVFQGRRWTYLQFNVEVDRVAKGLIATDVKPGEHVGIWITNRPEFLFLLFAITKIGAVVIPFSTRFRTSDLGYALGQSDTATLISIDRSGPVDYTKMLEEVLGDVELSPDGSLTSLAYPALRRVIMIGQRAAVTGALEWDTLIENGLGISDELLSSRSAAVETRDLAMILYTSGSTGYPKGVMLDHEMVFRERSRLVVIGATSEDVQLNYLPLFHILPIAHVVLLSMLSGGKQVLMETFDPVDALGLIEREKVTAVTGFDTHYRELMQAREINSAIDITSLRAGVLAAGLAPTQPVAVRAQDFLCPTLSTYGATESGGGISLTARDGTFDQRTVASGYPLPGMEIRIIDPETGIDMPEGEQGEIIVRGPGTMLGYYNDPGQTRSTRDSDGWVRTGDAGLLRPDGHLRFVGRYKDMLKVGGENVSSAEVELVLQQIMGIEQAAVIGVPDARLHEVAGAFVVQAEGADITLATIEAFCRGRIAGFKIPRYLQIVRKLPMTASGKVEKHLLQGMLNESTTVA